MKRRSFISPIVWIVVLAAAGGQWLLGEARESSGSSQATRAPAADSSGALPVGVLSSVPPHRSAGYQPQVKTGIVDYRGQEVGVACMTCHTTKKPNLQAGRGGATPVEFHQGLVYAHAAQSCLSCHNSENYDVLRLADGSKLAFSDAQKLCQQCHGPQTRDYLHGSHGGMTGYWDKTKGTRTRNTCTDCHDPHAPAYPALMPVFAPVDAGALQQKSRDEKHSPATETPHHE